MKNLFFLMVFTSALFIACKNEKPNPDLANGTETSTEQNDSQTPDNLKAESTHKIFPSSKNSSPQIDRARATLAKNYWVCNAYLKIKDFKKNEENQGRWYKFNEDGTFKVGKFEEEISTGTWSFNYADSTGQVSLDAVKTEEDGLWNVKFASDESLMIWVGTEEFQTNSIQQRLENLLFIPKNRKEMGLK